MKMLDIARRFGAARASLVAALALFGLQPAFADECVGKPGPAVVYKDGLVAALITWNGGGSGFYHICNTSGEFGGTSSEVCLSWYATLMRAKTEKWLVTFYFDTGASCASLPDNSATPSVRYVGLYTPEL